MDRLGASAFFWFVLSSAASLGLHFIRIVDLALAVAVEWVEIIGVQDSQVYCYSRSYLAFLT